MKKTLIVIVVLVIIGLVLWKVTSSPLLPPATDNTGTIPTDTTSIPSSQTIKVSDKLSEYKNDELGFSVKYPTAWEKLEAPSNVVFAVNYSTEKEKNTIGKLESKIEVVSGTCGFPPTTTIKERSSVKVKDLTFNMISMLNTVQGRNYFNRMYTLQKDSICYYFTFSSITLSPSNKGYTGADAQKVGARNVLLVDTADSQFKDMINTFSFNTAPVGQDETKLAPKK
jgi:hypothetical protein